MNGNQIDSTLNFVFYRHKLIYNDVFIINFEQEGIIIASNNLNNHKNLCSQIKSIINQ